MPNHLHGILNIDLGVGAGLKPAQNKVKLSEIIRSFKTFSARKINELRKQPGVSVWQRNYYEHIIRNDKELSETREYIKNNVVLWKNDIENTKGIPNGQV
jgi:REP element-mobilizing transposase RayT